MKCFNVILKVTLVQYIVLSTGNINPASECDPEPVPTKLISGHIFSRFALTLCRQFLLTDRDSLQEY